MPGVGRISVLKRPSPSVVAVVLTILIAYGLLSACTQPIPSASPEATVGVQDGAAAGATEEPVTLPETETAVPTKMPMVTIVKDVPYLAPLQDSAKERSLDIYVPVPSTGDLDEQHPVVVFAHGYNQGKNALATVCRALAERGAVVYAPSWRTDPSTAASWREMTESLACAVRTARASAPDYNGNPDDVTLVGFSMGGSVGAIVALNGAGLDDLWSTYAVDHDGPPAQVRCLNGDISAEVQAFVGIGGAYALPDRFEAEDADLYSLLTAHSTSTDLRITLLHGAFDSTVPPIVSEDFRQRLIAAGYAPTLASYDSGHTIPRDVTVEAVLGSKP